jgi:hypothetical protein
MPLLPLLARDDATLERLLLDLQHLRLSVKFLELTPDGTSHPLVRRFGEAPLGLRNELPLLAESGIDLIE